jgi:hypothetical protein
VPTLLRWRGHRFFCYSADGGEPAHVHVSRAEQEAKIWLSDLTVAVNFGYSLRELGEIVRKVREQRAAFLEAWNDHFANRG